MGKLTPDCCWRYQEHYGAGQASSDNVLGRQHSESWPKLARFWPAMRGFSLDIVEILLLYVECIYKRHQGKGLWGKAVVFDFVINIVEIEADEVGVKAICFWGSNNG